LLVFLAGAAGTATENEILIEGEADDIAAPPLNDELNFGSGERGSGEEALFVGAGVFEARSVDAAEEDGFAGGGVDDAVAGGAEEGEVVGEMRADKGLRSNSQINDLPLVCCPSCL
jgi:hypothetical protein